MAAVIFLGSPLSKKKLFCSAQDLMGSGDWETDLVSEDWEVEGGKQSSKLIVKPTASIDVGKGKNVSSIT